MNFEFHLPDEQTKREFQAELINHTYAKDFSKRLVVYRDKLWIVKESGDEQDRNLELLVSMLGDGLVNVSEVKPLSENEIVNIKSLLGDRVPNRVISKNTTLVRLAQRYSVNELPLQDLDSAVASELFFCTWLRRRDTHNFNRAYLQGIPVFFDLHTALIGNLWEGNWLDIDAFFGAKSRSYAGSWRVRVHQGLLTTATVRRSNQPEDVHYISDRAKFEDAVKRIETAITSDNRDVTVLVQRAGFEAAKVSYLADLIEKHRNTLHSDIQKMLNVIWQA